MIDLTIEALAASVILLTVYIVSAKLKNGKKLKVNVLLAIPAALFGLALYYAGYLFFFGAAPGGALTFRIVLNSALRSIFSTVRMFLGNDDYSVFSGAADSLADPLYLALFWICHVLALAATVSTVLSVFGKRLITVIVRFFSFGKKRYVICGVNEKSLCFGQNVMSAAGKSLVIYIDENAGETQRQRIFEFGGVFLDEDIFRSDALNLKAVRRAGFGRLGFCPELRVMAFTESDVTNFVIAAGLLQAPEACSEKLKGLYVYTDSSDVISQLEAKNKAKTNLVCFTEEDLAARKLLAANPLYKQLEPGRDKETLTLVILGFGSTGRHILQKALYSGQFVNSAFTAHVFDKRMSELEGTFRHDYPELFNSQKNGITIRLHPHAIGSSALYAELESVLEKEGIDHVVACLGDDNLNLAVISEMKRFMRSSNSRAVFSAHITDKRFSHFRNAEDINKIDIFGDYDDIFTQDIIVHEEMDLLAKAVNASYQFADLAKAGREELNKKSAESWHEQSTHIKNSNRAAAAFIRAHLYVLGLELITKKESRLAARPPLTGEEFEDLFFDRVTGAVTPVGQAAGQTEHLRWNAFHYTYGWTELPIDEVTTYASRIDEKKKKHACLVGWDTLPLVGDTIMAFEAAHGLAGDKAKYDFRKKDINAVAKIHDIIQVYNSDNCIHGFDDKELCIVRRL
jgi:hypothetical protein